MRASCNNRQADGRWMAWKKLGLWGLACLWLAAGSAPAWGQAKPAPEEAPEKPPLAAPALVPDTVALILPLSGPWENFGRAALGGAELAWDEVGGGLRLVAIDEADPNQDLPPMAKVAVAVGHLFDTRLADFTPKYQRTQKPVLLPFISQSQAVALGPDNYFGLMPSASRQGEALALWALKGRRPSRILVLRQASGPNRELADRFGAALAEPPQPPPGDPKKRAKTPPPLKPVAGLQLLEKTVAGPEDLQTALEEAAALEPQLVLLALDNHQVWAAALALAETEWGARAAYAGGAGLADRETGALLVGLGLKTHLALPFSPSPKPSDDLRRFERLYLSRYQQPAPWPAFLAYDAMILGVRATSFSAAAGDASGALTFLAEEGREHQGLAGVYKLRAGGALEGPLEIVELEPDFLIHLP